MPIAVRFGYRPEGGRGGFSLPEALAVLLILALLLATGVVGVRAGMQQARLRAAARRVALLVRWMRSEAVRGRSSVGVVFRRGPDGVYRFDLYRDGDGDGIRTRDIDRGIDVPFAGPFRIPAEFPGIRFGILDRGAIPAVPPSRGRLVGVDPIRFGRADIVSFSPRGRSSSGTFYLTDGERRMIAVVVYGPTARLRVWTWRDAAGRWER